MGVRHDGDTASLGSYTPPHVVVCQAKCISTAHRIVTNTHCRGHYGCHGSGAGGSRPGTREWTIFCANCRAPTLSSAHTRHCCRPAPCWPCCPSSPPAAALGLSGRSGQPVLRWRLVLVELEHTHIADFAASSTLSPLAESITARISVRIPGSAPGSSAPGSQIDTCTFVGTAAMSLCKPKLARKRHEVRAVLCTVPSLASRLSRTFEQ